MRSISPKLEGRSADGTLRTAGCVLPGFRTGIAWQDARFYTLFERFLIHPRAEPYWRAYLERVQRIQNDGLAPEEQLKWQLVFEGQAIRNLFYARHDRLVSLPFRKELGLEKTEEKKP